MVTKEQERKALQDIRDILDSLGEGSYVGTALEGCLDVAAENIENDWGCSMKERAEAAEAKAEMWHTEAKQQAARVEAVQKNLKDANDRLADLDRQYKEAARDAYEARRVISFTTKDGKSHSVETFDGVHLVLSQDLQGVVITQENGWADSYKLDDLKTFYIN